MLENVRLRWQTLIAVLRRSKRLSFRKSREKYRAAIGRQSALVVDAQSQTALDEYRRSFTPRFKAQENQTARFLPGQPSPPRLLSQVDRGHATRPPRDRNYPSPEHDTRRLNPRQSVASHDLIDARELHSGWAGNHNNSEGEYVWRSAPKALAKVGKRNRGDQFGRRDRSKKRFIAAALAGGIAVCGAYVYKTIITSGADSVSPLTHAEMLSGERPEHAEGRQHPYGRKSIYDRLTPEGPRAEPPSMADHASRPIASLQPTAAGQQGLDRPTIVRSEIYRPDGTRVDPTLPVLTPQSRPPFRSAARSEDISGQVAPQAKSTVAAEPPAQVQAESAPAASGYFVQIKSDQDQEAANQELISAGDKYKSVLNGVPLVTRSVDLGNKGTWFRLLAGPLNSQEEASDLCAKLRRAGLSGCIVHKSN